MSCNGKETGRLVEFFVHIGMPIDYDRCGRVLDCMNSDHIANSITNWHCEDDCRVVTYLRFNSFINIASIGVMTETGQNLVRDESVQLSQSLTILFDHAPQSSPHFNIADTNLHQNSTGFALAARDPPPCNNDVNTVPTDETSCTAKEMGFLLAQYYTHIGKVIDYGLCDKTIACLNHGREDAPPVTSWHCEDDCRSGTYLDFVTWTHVQDHINGCLNDVWFGGVDTFNCPSH